MIAVTIFRDASAAQLDRRDLAFEQLAEMIERADEYPSKAACPWLKLAEFGDKRTDNGSLRHNANVISISGVEGDYDGEQVTLSEAAAMIRDAGVKAILYTSPSHRPEAPRWRVLAPLSQPATPDARRGLLARLNGALGGILSTESFVLSQSYYYGRVAGQHYQTERVEGEAIDRLPELREVYPQGRADHRGATFDATTDNELRARFACGEGRHEAMLKLSARWAARGMDADDIEAELRKCFAENAEVDSRNSQGIDLLGEVGRIAASAARRFRDPRQAFHDESRAIGEGGDSEAAPPMMDLPAMLNRAVFISDGSQVALRDDPRVAWSFSDFANLTAASVTRGDGFTNRSTATAKAWLRHPQRLTVQTRTFKAGAPLFCKSPQDILAVNSWREPPRHVPPDDWARVAEPFLSHVAYLVPLKAERELFLNWLAHIEQCPGVLPHVHVLMYSQRQGVGRNWLACVLARVWAGATALDVDLPALLDGGFNARLSRKVFAVVNEVREGDSINAYRHANRLRTLLTDETRQINPKYGRQYEEFNAMRWLMLSNHAEALPLDRFDRRVFAIANPEQPRPAEYYARLYGVAGDLPFIASVREWLRRRDISSFNPGMHAPMSETKRRIIDASTPEAEMELRALVGEWPSDVIGARKMMKRLFGDGDLRADQRSALRHMAARQGVGRYPRRVTVGGRATGGVGATKRRTLAG